MPEVETLLRENGVMRVEADLCRFGLETVVKGESRPAKKPTSFATNSWAIVRELTEKCLGDHVHGHLMEGRAKASAVYPPGLCAAICNRLHVQIEHDESKLISSRSMSAMRLSSLVASEYGFPSHWVDNYHEVDARAKMYEDKMGEQMLKKQLFKLSCRKGMILVSKGHHGR